MHVVEFGKDPRVYVDTFADPQTPPQVSVHAADGRFLAWIEQNKLDAQHPYWPYRDAHIVPEFGTLHGRRWPDAVLPAVQAGELRSGASAIRSSTRTTAARTARSSCAAGPTIFPSTWRSTATSCSRSTTAAWRGAGAQFSDGIYKQLGKLEVEDQVAGIRWLKTQPFVDPQRIGVFGWSYGGYMTAMLLAKASDEIAAGVAVAPVVDWSLYDTFYTERYLDTPQHNAEGYELSGVLHWLDGLKSPLLLVHGMADDNVQFTNSTQLMAGAAGARHPVRPDDLSRRQARPVDAGDAQARVSRDRGFLRCEGEGKRLRSEE